MQVLPLLLWATPRPPARATALSTGTTRHLCIFWVILVSFLSLPFFPPSLDIFHEKSNGLQINVEAKYFIIWHPLKCSLLCRFNLHLWKGIMYEWEENRIGKLFLWAWRHFYDIYWFLHNFAAVLWPLQLCCTLKARKYRVNSGLTNNWDFSSVSRRRNWKPLKNTDTEQSIPAILSFSRCRRGAKWYNPFWWYVLKIVPKKGFNS